MPQVFQVKPNFYAEWRVRSGIVPVLHEDCESPPEELLQAVWQHQRLIRDRLKMIDGRPARILHPGFRSVEGGPDFRGAMVQFGDEAPRTGDIEVDLRASGWRAHGHDRNPAFQNVILHVIWEGDRPAVGGPPVLALIGTLDSKLGELSLWLGSEAAEGLPERLRGRCCAPLRGLAAAQLTDLLHQAAHVRLQSKASQFQARARQAGWEQALWEGLFRALGYKNNVWPMQRLAELRPRWAAGGAEVESGAPVRGTRSKTRRESSTGKQADVLALQARLLGISGLLPVELTRSQAGSDDYLRQVWDWWWREREAFADCSLPHELWRLHGLRPANHPQRRLALASHWSAAGDLPQKLEQWCASQGAPGALANSLLEALQVAGDEFWSWHCTFRSARFKKAQPLLGAGRVTDLAVNVVLPWLWVRAVEGKNGAMQKAIEKRYFEWPAAEDNAVLRLARQRLLGGASAKVLPDAAAQQGLMQIVRDFCEHSNALCDECKLPRMVQEIVGGG
jgi:hypothetical protein